MIIMRLPSVHYQCTGKTKDISKSRILRGEITAKVLSMLTETLGETGGWLRCVLAEDSTELVDGLDVRVQGMCNACWFLFLFFYLNYWPVGKMEET